MSLDATYKNVSRDGRQSTRTECLVHIGYHRTGTSFLQTELFPLIDNGVICEHLHEATAHISNEKPGLVILTDERLSSDLNRDKPELATDLAKTFPGARVLIGIRSQYSIMRGAYHLVVKTGATQDYETFVKERCGVLFDYERMIGAYRAAFGSDRVFILPHEYLLRERIESMGALLRFLGYDPQLALKVRNRTVKPSVGDAMLRVLRQRNRFIAPLRSLWPQAHTKITYRGIPGARLIERTFGKLLRLPADRMRPIIRDAYGESNARLFASLPLNMSQYDYPLPNEAS